MTREDPWDLLVLGGGTAGIVAAKTAVRLGARALLIEQDRTGGDCLWTGCVPSKALIAAARGANEVTRARQFGVMTGDLHVDFARTMAYVHEAIAEIAPVDSPDTLRSEGVVVEQGRGRFVGHGQLDLAGRMVRFIHAVVATGGAPSVPPIPGLDQIAVLTSENLWDLKQRPGRLAVLGGGSIGCELGQALARLGVEVTLIEGAARILPSEDREAAEIVHRALEADGVSIRVNQRVVAVAPADAESGSLVLDDQSEVPFDRLLVATGREPRTSGIGLETLGVEVDDRGFIVVDDHLRTTHDRIWAAGDITGHPQFTHLAGTHGSLAASNAVLGLRRSVDRAVVPRVTYTDPEVAAVGISTERATRGVRILTVPHQDVDRAVMEAATDGVSRLAVDRRGRIHGATLVGPRAGESLGEVSLAIRSGLRTRDLAGMTHPYPTWNDGVWNAAISDVRSSLDKPATRHALRAVARVRRWWIARHDH